MPTEDSTPTTIVPRTHRPFFAGGVVMFVLGPILYFVQVGLKNLKMPWYLPGLASIGVVLMIASVRQRRGVWRMTGLVLFAALCGAEWYMLVVAAKTPPYTGPARPGSKIPEFVAQRADGTAFTANALEDGQLTALVFFRGRW